MAIGYAGLLYSFNVLSFSRPHFDPLGPVRPPHPSSCRHNSRRSGSARFLGRCLLVTSFIAFPFSFDDRVVCFGPPKDPANRHPETPRREPEQHRVPDGRALDLVNVEQVLLALAVLGLLLEEDVADRVDDQHLAILRDDAFPVTGWGRAPVSRRSRAGASRGSSLAASLALLAAFPLHHTLLAAVQGHSGARVSSSIRHGRVRSHAGIHAGNAPDP